MCVYLGEIKHVSGVRVAIVKWSQTSVNNPPLSTLVTSKAKYYINEKQKKKLNYEKRKIYIYINKDQKLPCLYMIASIIY